MKRHPEILERMQLANPVPEPELIVAADVDTLTSLLNERRSQMTDLKEVTRRPRQLAPPPQPWWRRPVWVFSAAAVLVLVVVGSLVMLGPGGGGITEPATEPPISTTTAAPSTTVPRPTTAPPTTLPPTTAALPAPLAPPVIDTNVDDIAFDGSGDAWVVGAGGLFRLRDGAWDSPEFPAGFSSPSAIETAPDGTVWIAGHDGGLAHYAAESWTVYPVPETIDWNGDEIALGGGCGTLTIDAAGGVWAICPDMLLRLEDEELVPAEVMGELYSFWWLLAGPDGTVYGSGFEDIWTFDGAAWSPHECPAPGPSLAGCAVLLGVDSLGDLWVSVGWEGLDGLIRFRGPDLTAELITAGPPGATDMSQTPDGDLWFTVPEVDEWDLAPEQTTVPEAGVYRFDGAAWRRYTIDDGLSSNSAVVVEVSSDGSLWVGTSVRHVEIDENGIPHGGDMGGGIDVYDPATDSFAPQGGGQ